MTELGKKILGFLMPDETEYNIMSEQFNTTSETIETEFNRMLKNEGGELNE